MNPLAKRWHYQPHDAYKPSCLVQLECTPPWARNVGCNHYSTVTFIEKNLYTFTLFTTFTKQLLTFTSYSPTFTKQWNYIHLLFTYIYKRITYILLPLGYIYRGSIYQHVPKSMWQQALLPYVFLKTRSNVWGACFDGNLTKPSACS